MHSQVKPPYKAVYVLSGFFLKLDSTRAVKPLLWQRKSLGLMRQGRNGVAAAFAWAGNEGVFRLTNIFASLLSSFLPCLPAGDSRDLENGSRTPSRVSSHLYRAGTCHLSVCIPNSQWCFLASMHTVQLPTWKKERCINMSSYAIFSE